MNTCKEICKGYSSIRDGQHGTRYDNGAVFCKHCNIFMKYEGKYCPCCGKCVRHSCRYTKHAM